MKKSLTVFNLFLVLFFLLTSCKNQSSSNLPKVKNLSYKMYDIKGERGYNITFSTDSSEPEAVAVVINGIKKNILPTEKRGNQYFVTVISQTQRIENYKVETADQPNGIYFKSENGDVFKEVTFQLLPQRNFEKVP